VSLLLTNFVEFKYYFETLDMHMI